MQKINKTDLGSESVGKLLFKLALPSITAQIVNLLYNLVDRMYIGHIPVTGSKALTGLGITFPLIVIISAFVSLVSIGGATRSSIMLGAEKKDTAEKILGNCTILLVITSIVLTIVFTIFGNKLLLLFGASENTIKYASDYFRIYTLGTIFVQLSLGLNAFITSQGFTKTSMYTVLIGAFSNIILDPIFIFTLNMGVKGAALATVISQGISAVWVVKFLTGNKTILKIQKKYFIIEPRIILPCLALGLSPFVMTSTESLLAVSFNVSLQKYGGDMAVGAMTILTSVMQFTALPLRGLTQGAQPIISFNFGACNVKRVKDTFRILFKSCVTYSTTIWLLVLLFPQIFIIMFTSNAELTDFTIWALRIYMAVSFLTGIQNACQNTFIAIGNAKTSLFLAVLRKIILLIPFIYILPHIFENKLMAVFLAEPVADFIAVSTTSCLFYFQFRTAMNKISNKQQGEKHFKAVNQ